MVHRLLFVAKLLVQAAFKIFMECNETLYSQSALSVDIIFLSVQLFTIRHVCLLLKCVTFIDGSRLK